MADQPRRSLLQLVAEIPTLIGDLIRAEIEALKTDLKLRVKRLGIGAGLIGGALVLLCLALTALVVAAVAGLALVLPFWAAALIVGGGLLVIAGVLVWIAIGRFQGASPDVAGRVESLKTDAQLIQGVRKGRA